MVYKLIITPEAEEDLDGIFNYIRNHFFAPQAATNTMKNSQLSLQTIAGFPSLGIDVSERIGRTFSKKHPLLMMISGSYLIFYICDEEQVTVLRIPYQKRHWIDIFR